ncbi:dihydrofolate reductase [Paenibacillus sp. T1]|uniref:Dihydrofolate reductase n=2 Tax=Paenibacillus glycinis TaxID=2697035 RepID=A0ABW9XL16_9BACL|nr:dihydrofolate reductase [Paenibacillus glycinis]
MKTMLWATLTANGNYAQSGPDNPPKQEALEDFAAQARAAGNFIVGRRTFEGMLASGGGGAFGELDIVVVSSGNPDLPGVKVAASPKEALRYLRERGHRAALLSGGAELHNAFLGQGLVDELVFVIAPTLEGKGLRLLTDTDKYKHQEARLLDFKALGNGVLRLRYGIPGSEQA